MSGFVTMGELSLFILGVSLGFVLMGLREDVKGTKGSSWDKATFCLVLVLVLELIMRGR